MNSTQRTLAFAGQGSRNDWLVVLTARFLNLRTPGQDVQSSQTDTECDLDFTTGVQQITQPTTRLDQNDILQLVSDYVSGSSVRQLARDWNVHRTTVMDHLKRHNIPRRPHVRKMTDTQVEEAAELYRAGTSLAKLGSRYHVDPQTVSKELKRAGVTIRPAGRWG